MRLKIINPNTTQTMTDSILKTAKQIARKDTEVSCVSPRIGPESIESYYDEYLSVPGILEEIEKGEKSENIDAYVIACFGDPGLYAAREISTKPVIGIAEAAILTSKMISPNFSIVSVLDRSRHISEELVQKYGVEKWCCSIRTTGLSVLEFSKNPEKGLKALLSASRMAINVDGAECILLGCAGFVDFLNRLRQELAVPVLDGVTPAVKMAESLVDLDYKTSKVLTWKFPEKKDISS